MKYKWKNTCYKISAEKAGKCLDQIQKKYGKLTPDFVVQEAKNSKHPLHNCFDWNDSIAANKWRKEQARNMIQSITVFIEDRPEVPEVRAYVNVKDGTKHKYITVNDAMDNDQYREQVLQDAYNEIIGWRNKYHNLNEFSKVFVAINKIKIA